MDADSLRTVKTDRDENGFAPNADHVSKTASNALKVEKDDRTRSERVSDSITAFSGSIFFVCAHVLFFAAWIFINVPGSAFAFDPFPFSLLTMIVSLEAIFLSTFVLISQNRQAKQAEKRAKVDLQVDMIAEQEITKLMEIVLEIHDRLGIRHTDDPDLHQCRRQRVLKNSSRTPKPIRISGRK